MKGNPTHSNEQVMSMIETGLWNYYAIQLRIAARERGIEVTSVTLLSTMVLKLRERIEKGGA